MATAPLRFEDRGGGHFAVEGVLGFPTAAAALASSRRIFAGQRSIEVDLSGVTQTDSAGLALLIEWLSWARSSDRQMKFSHLPEQIRAIARISEVEELLGIAPEPAARP